MNPPPVDSGSAVTPAHRDHLMQVVQHLRANAWTQAHDLVQREASAMANWLHGIVHVQEGDLEDAQYWYEQAGQHFRSRRTLAAELARFEQALLLPADQAGRLT